MMNGGMPVQYHEGYIHVPYDTAIQIPLESCCCFFF